jgi:hypothetical protein
MAYPTPRCAGCAHYPHDNSPVCGAETDPDGRNGVTCNCHACSRCGHLHDDGQACTWKITDTSNCGCTGPRPVIVKITDTSNCGCTGPKPTPVIVAGGDRQFRPERLSDPLMPLVAKGIQELIEKHASGDSLSRLAPVQYEGEPVPWPILLMLIRLATRNNCLAELPRLEYLGVPVPWGLLPNWDQMEISWWRRGVGDAAGALEHTDD